MTIHRSLILSLTILLTSAGVRGQDFQPGFIVNNAGDSLRGFIHKGSLEKGFKSCRFKFRNEDLPNTFEATSIRSFGTDSALYQSTVSLDPHAIVLKPGFLKVLIEGPVSLWVDANNSIYFRNGITSNLQSLENKNALVELFSSCNLPEANLVRLQSTDSEEVVAFFSTHYSCLAGGRHRLFKYPETVKPHSSFFIVGGAVVSTLGYKPTEWNGELALASFDPSYSPSVGLRMKRYLSNWGKQRGFLQFELDFFHSRFETVLRLNRTPTIYDEHTILHDFYTVVVPVQAKWMMITGRNYVVEVGVGVSLSKNILKENLWTTVYYSPNNTETVTTTDELFLNSMVCIVASVSYENFVGNRSISIEAQPNLMMEPNYKFSAFMLTFGVSLNKTNPTN